MLTRRIWKNKKIKSNWCLKLLYIVAISFPYSLVTAKRKVKDINLYCYSLAEKKGEWKRKKINRMKRSEEINEEPSNWKWQLKIIVFRQTSTSMAIFCWCWHNNETQTGAKTVIAETGARRNERYNSPNYWRIDGENHKTDCASVVLSLATIFLLSEHIIFLFTWIFKPSI